MGKGIRPDSSKLEAVTNWKTTHSPRAVQKFLGTVGWMKKFDDRLEVYVADLSLLTSSKMKKNTWGAKEQLAFDNIKSLITTLPCLKNMDNESNETLWFFTDVSGSGIGTALFQGKEWKTLSPLAQDGRVMTPAERNYLLREQELLAVIHTFQNWHLLLLGSKINVMSDHHTLIHLLSQKTFSCRQACWLERLSEFDVNLIT